MGQEEEEEEGEEEEPMSERSTRRNYLHELVHVL